ITDRQEQRQRKARDRGHNHGDEEGEGLTPGEPRDAAQAEPGDPAQNLPVPEGADLVAEKWARRGQSEEWHGDGSRYPASAARRGPPDDGRDNSAATGVMRSVRTRA